MRYGGPVNNWLDMSIRDESYSSQELIRDSLYHRAACTASPQTQSLAAGIKTCETALKSALTAAEQRDETRVERQAQLDSALIQLQSALRAIELEVMLAVDKKRTAPGYRAVFPKKLSGLLETRPQEIARTTTAMLAALDEQHPQLGKKYRKTVEPLAAAVDAAHKVLEQAVTDAETAFAKEVLARVELVKKLRQNEGALLMLFPGDKTRVRAFFRDSRARKVTAARTPPTPPSPSADGPAPSPV